MNWIALALFPLAALAAVDEGKSGVTTTAKPTLAWREWTMEARAGKFFRDEVAPLCLTTPLSKVTGSKKRTRLLETRSCGEQLEGLAQSIERSFGQKKGYVLHIVRAPETLWAPTAALIAKRSQDFKPEEVIFDRPTTACACLVFSGSAADAVRKSVDENMLRLTGSTMQGRRIVLPPGAAAKSP